MNSADQVPREKALFEQALDLASAAERLAFLHGACGEDAALLARVQALLQAHETAEGFLPEEPAGPATLVPVNEKPGDRIGRYKLRERIGEGGCGVVYVAEQEEPVRRKVALKVVKLGMDTRNVVARFQAERQALALMDHPNIAQVYDAGATETGRPYFVMELVRGIKITDYCDQQQLSTRERLELFIKVCQAIQHAHQKGVIHRDIKPSNILVTVNDGVPVPKVIDFGIAKATTGRLTDLTVYTDLHQFIGTPAYMSPEQATMTSLDIDTRSDIYSLGVLLYELLTGHTPFDTKELMTLGLDALRHTIREREPMRPSTRLSTMLEGELTTAAKHRASAPPELIHLVRGDLDWIVMKCLEKDRARRYETANGLAFDLKRHLNNEPVLARPPSTVYRLQKAWRRHKLVFTAAAVMAGALVVGTGVSSWQAIEASRARNAEKEQRLAAQTERDKARAAQKEAERAKEEETSILLKAEQQLYAARMNVAQVAWDQNNIGQLRQLLKDTQESPNRSFEWYYWQRQTHLALKTLRGHLHSVNSVIFSPDGHRIVTGSWDQTAKVWEAANGKELLTLNGHRGGITSVAFSPDGQRIVTGSADQTAKVWEAASGHELVPFKGHSGLVASVAFSPDGQRIVTGSWDQTAKVWEAATGRPLLTLTGHTKEVSAVAFSTDGQRIVTGSFDHTAKVWAAASGQELLTLRGHGAGITSVAFSPDGQRIVTGSLDNKAKAWDAASGHELLTLNGHSDAILSVTFSPNGQRILTGSFDQTAKVWEVASGMELLTLKGHSGQIDSVAFSPDGHWIVTGSEDQTAKVWEAASGREPLTLEGHTTNVSAVAFSPDGQRIVTGSWDQTAKVWEAASGRKLLTLTGHSDAISSVAFSPDGQRIVTGCWDSTAKVWEAASGHELLTIKGDGGQFESVAFSPDGLRIVTGSWDGTARVWEAASGRLLLPLKGHRAEVTSVAFSPDGQRIVTGSSDQTAKVWEAASGKELVTLEGHRASIYSVAFSPDGQRIVTGSWDHTAKVWEAASGHELLTLRGHSSYIYCAGFSPDGQRIVTGSWDHTVKVWEVARGGELLTLMGHKDGVTSMAFAPDGQRIVTGIHDGTARVWEAAGAEQVAAWQEEERAAAQYLAALRSERIAEQERQRIARARNSIQQWLVLAPIALATGQSGAEGLDIEQIEGEARLRPRAGEARSVGGVELKWREVALEGEEIDFNAILGKVTEHGVAYAVCYLQSEAEQRGLQMLVGSDDEAKVYLNGKQVHRSALVRPWDADQDTVPDLTLNAGLNVLVFKVVNETRDWKGSIRFTDAQGNPVKGIRVTLDPDAKAAP